MLFLTFSLMSSISILEQQFMGIQSPDIIADSTDTKQMLLTLNGKLDLVDRLHWRLFSLRTLECQILERLHRPNLNHPRK